MSIPLRRFYLTAVFSILFCSSLCTAAREAIKPILAIPDKIVLQDDFSVSEPLAKGTWSLRQHTRWNIEEGVLRGTPSEFVASFSIRFIGGTETSIAPFVEFGHHVARIKFSEMGMSLIADGESMKLDEAKDFKYESGKWYHAMAELRGDEFVIQFANGPTLYAKHPRFALPVSSGGAGFGVAGTKGGAVEIDELTLWSIKAKINPMWKSAKKQLTPFPPILLKEPK